MRLRLVGKWFLVGFGIRLSLAIILTLLIWRNLEASMLYFADIPTISFFSVWEKLSSGNTPVRLVGTHPYYIPLNLFASLIWGFIFALVPLTVRVIGFLRRRLA